MIYNILNHFLFDAEKDIIKLILTGTAMYGLIIIFLYTKYSNSIPYIKRSRKYIVYVAVADFFFTMIINRKKFIKKIKGTNNTAHAYINDYTESEQPPNPYEKNIQSTAKKDSPFIKISEEESESDIEFPIYKSS